MGISGTTLQWFKSHLSSAVRSFKVSWRGEVSKLQLLATGVPHGSVLGPLLFSIYMSSLGFVIQKHGSSYHCYADDTQLYFSFQPDDPMHCSLSDRHFWLNESQPSTSLQLLYTTRFINHRAFQDCRNLGVMTDDQLSLTDHIATTTQLDYNNVLLGNLPACTIKSLQLIQNAAVSVVFNKLKIISHPSSSVCTGCQ
ncbi:RNA-directed DNA polymerase from mobile element jockey [Labeo rohita]|uniref:RNA-directed DNA polymerase from mobile element jockey n=1 Tax=Labeo rohita TaxID=84645 RepID=A0ABQ8L7J0_LABRO|nr:RNA-directed DNA polymerase from mobile element jockey [Labeo rohita]